MRLSNTNSFLVLFSYTTIIASFLLDDTCAFVQPGLYARAGGLCVGAGVGAGSGRKDTCIHEKYDTSIHEHKKYEQLDNHNMQCTTTTTTTDCNYLQQQQQDSHGEDVTIRESETSRRAFVTSVAAAAILVTAQPESSNAADTAAAAAVAPATTMTAKQILQKSAKKAVSGGKAGATASIFQVLGLMWLRTSMNYQYRYGGTLSSSLSNLYEEGGVPRLYQGLPFALIQGPLTRFGDTAANIGILAFLDSIPELQSMPLPLKTACGSICAGLWRIVLMPVDTSKTVMQVEGKEGLGNLVENVKENGVAPLYRGAIASASATAVGHWPWFLTYNYLNDVLPVVQATGGVGEVETNIILLNLARSAFLGLSASCVSDVCSNSLRVLKTTKQTAGLKDDGEEYSYREAATMILDTDGWAGLFGRGLQTRLLTNAIQGAVFSVLWKYFQEVSS